MSKKTARKPLSRDELLKRFHPGTENTVDIPNIGLVRIQRPPFDRLIGLKTLFSNKADAELAVAIAWCPDLGPEDLPRVKADGVAAISLVAAVNKLTDSISDEEVGKQSAA